MAIIVEFVGGFMDGRRASSDSPNPDEADFALRHYFMSHEGEKGRKFKTISDAGLEIMRTEGGHAARERGFDVNHKYECVERIEKDGNILVRFKFVGLEH
jgi:hypothetical protein